ncbi:MAG TPA: TonB-dependent receptor plug domain-containing protein [Sphingomicrobium sp.]|nr:TonB-dependent receptor plug domain-containing protein [Sphingomicrobium sp.]
MLVRRQLRNLLLGCAASGAASTAFAHSPPTTNSAAAAPVATATSEKRVYTPADFARFAPKTAYDMLTEVPGFTIQGVDTSVRGLGQASENVLINGQRVANKLGAVDQLQRTPASSVQRIEIVDAASLGIAGLTGQVANVILSETKKASGQFDYEANARAHFAKPELLGGSVSYSGKEGPVDYTFSVANGYGRGAIGGPILILDPNHALIETRNEVSHNEFEQANMQAKFGIDGPRSSIGNLILGYAPYWSPSYLRDSRVEADGELRHRTDVQNAKGYVVDINGDYEFALGPGRLKLIGLDHWEHNPLVDTQILFFDTTGADPQGDRFDRDQRPLEVIGRAEYHWRTGKNDWQVSFERAFNSLAQVGRLFDLDPDGKFVEVPFPAGTGTVREIRYEGLGTFSRPLGSKLDLQAAAGAEISTLGLAGGVEPPRKFFRPKGSIVLGWHPDRTWDISLKLRRRVGQIDFADFLSQAILTEGRTNAGNVNLVPPQSWEAETDFAHDLGRWGKTDLTLHYYSVSDIIDFIRIGEDGEGVGNLPHADRLGFQSTSTFLLDPLGWPGAKLDATFAAEWTRVKDPLTGRPRPISGIEDHSAFVQIRDDIPHTPFAWSAYIQNRHFVTNYLLTELDQTLDIPWLVGFYVEDKNVLGTTVRFTVDNIFNGKHLEHRQVFDGFRDQAPIAFFEEHDEVVGPIFTLSVKGNF